MVSCNRNPQQIEEVVVNEYNQNTIYDNGNRTDTDDGDIIYPNVAEVVAISMVQNEIKTLIGLDDVKTSDNNIEL